MRPFLVREPRFAIAASLLLALAAVPSGCKLERAKIRTAREKPKQKISPPRTLQGSFVMAFEAAPGKRFPVHMSFAAEFAEDGRGLVLSTCLDGDGGLSKSDAKARIQPDKEVPLGLSGESPDSAKGMRTSGFRCAKEEDLQTRASNASNAPAPPASAPSGSSPVAAASPASSASSSTSTGTARPGNTLMLAGTTGTPASGTGAGNTPGNGAGNTPGIGAGNGAGNTPGNGAANAPANTAGNAPAADAAPGSYAFVSKPDAKGNTIRFTLRANDAGWQMENLNYYGVLAWVEKTDTIAQWVKE